MYEVVQISCGIESPVLATDNRLKAAMAYRQCLQSPCGARVRVNGEMLTILEADRFMETPDYAKRQKHAKQGQAAAMKTR